MTPSDPKAAQPTSGLALAIEGAFAEDAAPPAEPTEVAGGATPVPGDDRLARLQAELEDAGRSRDVLGEDLPPSGPDPWPVPRDALPDAASARRVVESLLLVADRPLSPSDLADALGDGAWDAAAVRRLLVEAGAEDRERGRGIRIEEVAAGFQLRTAPEAAPWVRAFTGRRPVRLSRPALEVLAIVAYRQPATRADLEEVRGVDSGAVLKGLLDRGLLRIIGRREEAGRPMTYGTSRLFLQVFGLRNLADLPSLKEFADLGPREAWEGPSVLDPAPDAAKEDPDG